MSEHRDEQDRWRELHDLLGLPPERGGSAPPGVPRAHVPEPVPEPKVFREEPVDEDLPRDYEEAPQDRPELAIVNDEAIAPPLGDEDMPPPVDEGGQAPPRSPSGEDDDRPRRGRRRGRRGRRSRSGPDEARGPEPLANDDTEVEPTDAEPAAQAPSGPAPSRPRRDDEERRPRRGRDRDRDRDRDRGRGRPGEPDVADEAVPGDDEVARRTPVVAADDDDEPIETFADWNVPSWPEIVASLYRPER